MKRALRGNLPRVRNTLSGLIYKDLSKIFSEKKLCEWNKFPLNAAFWFVLWFQHEIGTTNCTILHYKHWLCFYNETKYSEVYDDHFYKT